MRALGAPSRRQISPNASHAASGMRKRWLSAFRRTVPLLSREIHYRNPLGLSRESRYCCHMTSSQSIKPGDEVRVLMRISRRGAQVPRMGRSGHRDSRPGRKYADSRVRGNTGRTLRVAARAASARLKLRHGKRHRARRYEGWYVRTPEQFHLDKRRKMALFLLGESGIEFKFGRERSLTLEQIEALAEVVQDVGGLRSPMTPTPQAPTAQANQRPSQEGRVRPCRSSKCRGGCSRVPRVQRRPRHRLGVALLHARHLP